MKLRSNTTRVGQLTQTVAVVDPCTIVVAARVPEVDPVDIADLFANRVAADLVMAVFEVAVVYNRDAITDTILAVVDPSTFVVAELVPMGVVQLLSVEVAAVHNKSRQTNTNCGGCGLVYNRDS